MIPKKMAPENLKEVRIVLMTPYISRVLERVIIGKNESEMFRRMNPCQFGGRPKTGTLHVLAEVFQSVIEKKMKGKRMALIFFDFTAAFNSGHRKDMVKGFESAGFEGKDLELIKDFLAERRMVITNKSWK